MTSCESHETNLSSLLDGEVSGAEQLALLDHLVRCASCRGFYRDARSLDGIVALVRTPREAPGPSRELWKSIESRAAVRPVRSSLPGMLLRTAAVLVAAAGVGLGLWSTSPRTAGVPSTIDVRLGEDRGRMTDARFFELATELLRSDRRYQVATLEVMRQVTDDTRTREASEETAPATEGRGRGETSSRRQPA